MSVAAPSAVNIALVIERFNPQGGGAERSAAQIAGGLATRGHRVTVLCGVGSATNSDCGGVTVVPCFHGSRFDAIRLLRFVPWVREKLKQEKFDVSLSFTTAVPAMVVEPRSGIVREDHLRNVARRDTAAARRLKQLALALSLKHRALLSLERKTLADPSVRRFVAISRYIARQLESHYAVAPERIVVIPNGAEVEPLDTAARDHARQVIRRNLNVPSDHPLFLFPANDPWRKGFVPLVRALRRMVESGRPGVVLIAGATGYAMQELAARTGVRDRIRFIGPTQRPDFLYAAADVTVLPTFYDPASKVVLESLMLGTPVVTTAFNGASDAVISSDGVARGRIIDDPWDIAALADAMTAVSDPAENARCRAATAGLNDELSMRRHVDRLEQLFQEIR